MAEALRLAGRVPRRPWPNPPVGALVVGSGGEVVGRGGHEGAGTAHAEVVALQEAGERARGATLYCTLEPCNHHGRTPPCTPALIASGVRRVVIGVRDPNPVAAGGLERLLDAGIEVTLGVCAEEALELVWPFVVTEAFGRPFVWLKTATSLDGRFAPAERAERRPVYLTGERARHQVHVLRRWADVVLVGGATLRADAPRLDGRMVTADDACPACEPLPAVATSQPQVEGWAGRRHVVFAPRRGGPRENDLTQASLSGRRQAPPPRITSAEAPRGGETGPAAPALSPGTIVVECDACEGGVDPQSIVEAVASLGAHALLVEGGPRLAAAFLSAGLVDRWIAYTAPLVLGCGAGWPGREFGFGMEFSLTRVEACGPDVKAVWDRVPFRSWLERLTAWPAAAGAERAASRGGA